MGELVRVQPLQLDAGEVREHQVRQGRRPERLLPFHRLDEAVAWPVRPCPGLGVGHAEVEEGPPVVHDVERVARDLDDDLVGLQLPGQVAKDSFGGLRQDHVRIPLEHVAGADVGERPVVEVDEAVHRLGPCPEVLLTAARHGEGIRIHLEPPGRAALLGHAPGDLRRTVGRAVVDQDDAVDGTEERRQDPRQRVGLVLRADDRREPRGGLRLRPGPDDVEIRVVLEVRQHRGARMPVLPRLRPLDLPLEVLDPARHAVELADPRVLLDGVPEDGKKRRDLSAPRLRSAGAGRGRICLVTVVLEVLRVPAEEDRASRVVIGEGRERKGNAVLAARGRGDLAAEVLGQECEGLVELLDPPDVVQRQLLLEIALHRPVDILGLAAGKGGHEAAEVLDHLEGLVGQAGEPRLLAEARDEARLPQEDLGLPGRPEPRARVTDDREAKPAVFLQDARSRVSLVVDEAEAFRPQAHVVDGEGGRHLGKRRVEEGLGLYSRESGEEPEDRGAAALRNRHEEDFRLGEDDRPLRNVLREGQFRLCARAVRMAGAGLDRPLLHPPSVFERGVPKRDSRCGAEGSAA